MMARKLEERQPNLVAGGAYANPTAALKTASRATSTTADRMESSFGTTDRHVKNSPSMLMTTVSTHVQLEHNDTFAWAWGLSSEKRAEYMHTTKALAKIRFKEQKVRAAGLRAVRSAKAQAEFDAAQASIERKEDGACDANLLAWLNETQLKAAYLTTTGKQRSQDQVRRLFVQQVTHFKKLGLFPTQQKGWSASKESVPALDALIRSCIQQRQLAVAASSSAASSAASGSASSASSSSAAASSAPAAHVDDDDDEDEDDDDGNEPYVMRCCNTLWTEGTVLVACSKCMDWLHLGKLGTCSGEGITRKKAQTRGYEHVCHLCRS
jgi:hypothetical protein